MTAAPVTCHRRAYAVHLARTGERLEVEAASVAEAIRQAGRPDACHLEPGDGGRIAATFDPEAPCVIDARCREATPAELKAWALALVVDCLDKEAAARPTVDEVRP